VRDYHLKYGKPFRFGSGKDARLGYYYPGRKHRHWWYAKWNSHYRCYFYYDRCTSAYYYWCKDAGCYYPVSCSCLGNGGNPPDPGDESGSGDDDVP
jgi:hypothetical protein